MKNFISKLFDCISNFGDRNQKQDPLYRFVEAQNKDYEIALAEIKAGKKQTHWIWYTFPQLVGLGKSAFANYYGIKDMLEAKQYLTHPKLGKRLRECAEALLTVEGKGARDIFGELDAMKVRSSMTLFDLISPNDIFAEVLDKYYNSKRCELTLQYTATSKGGILGAILGDIAGSRFEFRNEKSTDIKLFTAADKFTDDTVMTIAVADWLLTGASLPNIMRDWGDGYPDRGYGGMFYEWLFPLDENEMKPYNSYGNGAGMRVSPCGYAARTFDEALDLAKQSAEVTHNHPEGIKGAQAIAAAIYLARQHTPKEEIRRYIEHTFGYNLQRTCDDIRPTYEFDVTCQGSCPEAIIAFLDSTDYESAIRLAISLGGDSDTIACMTGGIAAAYYGIPVWMIEKAVKYLPADMIEIINRFDGRELKK